MTDSKLDPAVGGRTDAARIPPEEGVGAFQLRGVTLWQCVDAEVDPHNGITLGLRWKPVIQDVRDAIATLQAGEAADAGRWTCKARASTDPPQDCNWPHCGCDPYADKVLAALEEQAPGLFQIQHENDALRRIRKLAKVLKLEDVIRRAYESETITVLRLFEVIASLRIELARRDKGAADAGRIAPPDDLSALVARRRRNGDL